MMNKYKDLIEKAREEIGSGYSMKLTGLIQNMIAEELTEDRIRDLCDDLIESKKDRC